MAVMSALYIRGKSVAILDMWNYDLDIDFIIDPFEFYHWPRYLYPTYDHHHRKQDLTSTGQNM